MNFWIVSYAPPFVFGCGFLAFPSSFLSIIIIIPPRNARTNASSPPKKKKRFILFFIFLCFEPEQILYSFLCACTIFPLLYDIRQLLYSNASYSIHFNYYSHFLSFTGFSIDQLFFSFFLLEYNEPRVMIVIFISFLNHKPRVFLPLTAMFNWHVHNVIFICCFRLRSTKKNLESRSTFEIANTYNFRKLNEHTMPLILI